MGAFPGEMRMKQSGSSTRQLNLTGVGPICMMERAGVRKIRRINGEHGDER
jgi:hypothetical protein